jgi:hypothetical protein
MNPYTKSRIAWATLAAVLPIAAALPAHAAKLPAYHVTRTFQIGGDGGWDYLSIDPDTGRLYVSRGTHVQVVDTGTGKVVGDIPNTTGVHGLAVDKELNRGFTSNGRDASVSEINLATNQEVRRIKVDNGPDCIIYDPGSKRVFTFNGRSNDSTAIDAATGKVAGTIALDGRPEFAAPDGRGHVYVNIEDKSEIAQIDSKALKVLNVWSIAPADGPSGLAIDAKHHRLFSVTDGKMIVMDADTGKIVATPTIGDGPDAAGFDPKLGLAFSSNGQSGTLTVVQEKNPATFDVLADVPTQRGARTMALDTKTHRVYLAAAKFTPPPPGATGWQRRGTMVPGSFVILEVSP